ncbi:RNA-guided endonuclease InsQ/TnpB family protein [Leucobacter sp. HY1910]
MVQKVAHTKHLDDAARLNKNAQIKATGKATRTRRKKMIVQVRELRLITNRLNSVQREALDRLFLEAKWVRNTALDLGIFEAGRQREVMAQARVKVPGGAFEPRQITTLGGQMAQAVIQELNNNRRSLAALKKKGRRIGRIKFAREVTSIDLKQYSSTHKIDRASGRVKIANVTGWVKVRGLHQLDQVDELANAKLVRRPNGYFLLVTCYSHPRPNSGRATQTFQPGTSVGIDMGVATHVTLSNGVKLDAMFEETDRLRRLRRKLARQVKGSANHHRTQHLIRVESAKITRRKEECATKVAHELLKNERVYFQDENLSSWRKRSGYIRGGKRVHASILGRLKMILAAHPRTVMVDRWAATTATCVCGVKTPHHVSKRMFACPSCGYREDRDIHAAQNMIRFGEGALPASQELTGTPVEIDVRRSAGMDFASVPGVRVRSVKQEAATSLGSP